ncbi:MAG: restriction endonuclease subunit M, partial [Candidatus Kapabacteria bacterium]|nr:restriction endonuclease subunit M [Candidatus Kapabacteria bacterium]
LIIPNDKRDIYCIISQLNSKLFDYYHKAKSSGGNKAFAQFSGEYIASFPCIVHSKENDKFRLAVERIQSLKKALKDTTSKLHRSIVRKYELDIILEKLQDWYQLSFAEFIKELAKKKIKLSLSEEAEWEDYFTTEAKKALELQAQIDKTDKEIDQMVYKLYQLTDEEIKIVEGAV